MVDLLICRYLTCRKERRTNYGGFTLKHQTTTKGQRAMIAGDLAALAAALASLGEIDLRMVRRRSRSRDVALLREQVRRLCRA